MKELILEEPDPAFENTVEDGLDEYHGQYPEVNKPRYGTADRVFALVCFVLGYFVLRCFRDAGLGAFVTVLLMTCGAAAYMSCKGVKQNTGHYLYLAAVMSFSSVFVLSDDGLIKALLTVFIFGALAFYPYFANGSGRREFINDMFLFDMIKSVFIMPFSSIAGIFPAAFSGKRAKKSGFRGWHLAVGLSAAVIPTLVVTLLLCSADSGFESVMRSALEFLSHGVFEEILWFIAGTPVAMYIFGALFSNAEGKYRGVLTKEQHGGFLKAISFVPQTVACAAVSPLCILYTVFLSVQAKYYFGGFSSNLPDGMTYAEYARKGFFELCAVAVINMAVIIVLAAFTKKKEDGKAAVPLKICSTLMSCFTLLLIAVAMSKMIMYIDAYGLTRLRVFTSWFMILLAFAFIFVIVRQFAAKFNYFGALAAVFAVLFAVLCFSDVDGRIAEYNVNAYISGKTEKVDMVQLKELSDSAVPYILKLTHPVEGRSDEENNAVMTKAGEIISARKHESAEGYDIIHFNFPRRRAEKAAEPF